MGQVLYCLNGIGFVKFNWVGFVMLNFSKLELSFNDLDSSFSKSVHVADIL